MLFLGLEVNYGDEFRVEVGSVHLRRHEIAVEVGLGRFRVVGGGEDDAEAFGGRLGSSDAFEVLFFFFCELGFGVFGEWLDVWV